MRGGSCYSPNASGCSVSRDNRLLVGIGRTFEPTRSGTGSSFVRCRQTHASGQVLPLIRTLLKVLHHGSQARLRTFPHVAGDGGLYLLRFQAGKPRKPSTDHAALAHSHRDTYASVVIVTSCDTAYTGGNIETIWSERLRLRAGCRQFLQLCGPNALQMPLVHEVLRFDHTAFAIL